jgi:phosphoglycolate phosphatase
MKKKLIIFDMDGTLVDSSVTLVNAINHVRDKLSLEPMDENEILSKLNDHTINPAKYFYEADSFKADHEVWFSQYYKDNHKRELRLYKGIKELLQELKEKGFKLAVATNAYRVSTRQSLIYLDIIDYFDAIVCGDEVQWAKPHPDMLLKILDELNIKPQEAIFVGDGERDQEAAKRANIDYIMVHWGFSKHKEDDAVSTIEELKKRILEYA